LQCNTQSLSAPAQFQVHAVHTQRADLCILDLCQAGLLTVPVHSIVRNQLTAQLYQVFAHEPKRDARNCEFKSRLRCHLVSSTANRRENVNHILRFDVGFQLVGQIDRVSLIDKNVDMPTQVAAFVE
jgi:hypothetical protein